MSSQSQNWLVARSAASPSRLALVDGETSFTFVDLAASVDAMAQQLLESGLRAGDRVGLLAEGAELIVALHAVTRVGGIAAPLNARLTSGDHVEQLERMGAAGLIYSAVGEAASKGIGAVQSASFELTASPKSQLRFTRHGGRPSDEERGSLAGGFDLDDLHSIIFTSGTTGAGKAVALTYGNHWWNAFGSALNLGAPESDVWLGCMPLYHVGGISMLMKSLLYGAPVVIHRGFEAEAVNEALSSNKANMVSLVSTMLYRLMEERNSEPFPSTVRTVLLGGGPISPALVDASLAQSIPIAPTYGLTETGSQAATLQPEAVIAHPHTTGRALFAVDIRVARADAAGIGAIHIRGPSVSPGYVSEDGQIDGRDTSDWFDAGDLGRLDPDGYLTIADRRSDLIVTGGENVYPSEVEGVLRQHPGVADAAVFASADAEWGQVVAVAIVPLGQAVTAKDIDLHCRRYLPSYKCPKLIRLVESLPRTPSGKLVRRELMSVSETSERVG